MNTDAQQSAERAAELVGKLRAMIAEAMVGQEAVVDQVLIALLCSGHVLVEGMPGLGKTLLIRAMALSLSLQHARVQFTPDLMPSDLTGHTVLDTATNAMRVLRGPVFTNILLADEINRAPAKTQSALLEVMQEFQVTIEGHTMPLARPFMVMATQNPIETEGTYALPEAQLDRFLFKINIDYPALEEENAIVLRATDMQSGDQLPLARVKPCLDARLLELMQQATARQRVEPTVIDYAVRLARATRAWPGIAIGSGTRGAIALVRAARARALMQGRDFVTPDDIKDIAQPALLHRIALTPDAMLEGRRAGALIREVIEQTPAPRQ